MSIRRYTPEELRQVRSQAHDDIIVGLATMDASPRRPVPPSSRGAHRHRNRTPNLLANTSLDENLYALPPRAPGQMLCRRQREAIERRRQELENQEIEDLRLERQLSVEREQAQRDAEMALRRSERHDEHQKGLADIVSAVDQAVQKWQKDSPAAVKEFMRHYYNTVIYTSQPALIVDILLWFGGSEDDDHMPIEVEHSAYFPEETVFVAELTDVKKSSSGIEYVDHTAFGTLSNQDGVLVFHDKFTSKGEEEARYRYIKAGFRVRQVWYERVPLSERFEGGYGGDAPPHMIVSIWCKDAIEAVLELTKKPSLKLVKIADEMKTYVNAIEETEERVSEIKERVKKDLVALYQEYFWDFNIITPDRKALLRSVVLARHAEIEKEYGPDWKQYTTSITSISVSPSEEELKKRLPRFDYDEKRASDIKQRIKKELIPLFLEHFPQGRKHPPAPESVFWNAAENFMEDMSKEFGTDWQSAWPDFNKAFDDAHEERATEKRVSQMKQRINDGMIALFQGHFPNGHDGAPVRMDVFSDVLGKLVDDLRKDFGEEDWKPYWPDFDKGYDMAFGHEVQSNDDPTVPRGPEPEGPQGE